MRTLLLSLFALLINNVLSAQELVKGNLMIAPLPVSMEVQQGSFVIGPDTWIMMGSFNTFSFDPTRAFKEVFKKKSGYTINEPKNVVPRPSAVTSIITVNASDLIHKEGYNLKVNANGIIITASTDQGVFYAFQTLRQMMRMDALPDAKGVQRNWEIPAVEITDYPQFAYRGLHLDVCRHFMPLDFVKKYIDLLAYYKMNRFHWHLTDDQGWRIEIRQYPKLQEIAAWRDETLIGHYRETPDRYDGTRHGGYYTQEEIREVVAYAAGLGVTIIPEIEMPGHALAALSAYPELACTPGPFKSATTWGVFDDVMCPNEETFTFLQNVLDEVMALFPSPYIHIGGDECPKTRWKESDFCQELMESEGLKDEHELQSYFIQRIEKYVNSKGRSIIGWDEILEGGLAPNATVMSWRGVSGGIEAAKAGHDVIMTPGTHCYFDHYQADPAFEPLAIGGLTTLEKVYSFNPVPSKLTSKEAKHILGAQANLWTEYIDSPAKAEYMAYPRAIALAEALWTPASRKDWKGFVQRLDQHLERLDGMKVNYAKRLKVPEALISSGADGLQVIWKTDLPGQQISFTRDLSVVEWNQALSGDTTLFTGPGRIYYRTENSGTKELMYNPTLLQNAMISSS
ncbi:MAG: family 20 glycosylhydrolase, partial [Saprospiraceae bacterium]|nr:family 20 glycosylhydrolase [Saprospiraceae bacterium]